MLGRNIDLISDCLQSAGHQQASARDASAERRPQPYVGMLFNCCDVYCRVQINREGTAYEGYCPRCMRKVSLRADQAGSGSRFFTATPG